MEGAEGTASAYVCPETLDQQAASWFAPLADVEAEEGLHYVTATSISGDPMWVNYGASAPFFNGTSYWDASTFYGDIYPMNYIINSTTKNRTPTIDQAKSPTETVLIADGRFGFGVSNVGQTFFSARHPSRSLNAVFVDGHAGNFSEGIYDDTDNLYDGNHMNWTQTAMQTYPFRLTYRSW